MNIQEFSFHGKAIPGYMQNAMIGYIEHHKPVGDFLKAVICNDLKEATRYADDTNLWLLPVYVAYFYNEAPAGCWGSAQKYEEWLWV
jgi:hypothetical protein